MKFLNEAITFVFELLMLVAIFLFTLHYVVPLALSLTLSIGLALIVAIFWGLFLAPHGKRRFNAFWGLSLSSVMTAFGPITLLLLFPGVFAILVGFVYVINRTFAILWRQW